MNDKHANLTFNQLLPKLIDKYELPANDIVHFNPLADQANRLTPTFKNLSNDIWDSLPITEFQHLSDHTELARQATLSIQSLHARQQDVKSFAESICYEAIELRVRGQHLAETKAKSLRSAREPLCRAVQQVNRPLEPVLTAELMAQPLVEILPVLNHWLRNSCHTIAAHLLLSMHVLVQLDVVGLVEWPGESTCKLNFFKHVVTQNQIKRHRTQSIQQSEIDDSGLRSVRLETWEHIEGRDRYSIERHEHHVINAETHTVESARYPIPEEKRAFLGRVPPWIRQHLRILEGDLILEKIDEQVVGEKHWQSTPRIKSSYEIEPAIVLGHYVVTGWGQVDIEKEGRRRKRLESQTADLPKIAGSSDTSRRENGVLYSNWRPFTLAAAAASIALMFFSWIQPAVMVPASIFVGMIAVILCGRTAHAFSVWKHSTLDVLFVAATTTALSAAIFALLSGFYGVLFGSWSMLGIAFPLGFVAYIARQISIARLE